MYKVTYATGSQKEISINELEAHITKDLPTQIRQVKFKFQCPKCVQGQEKDCDYMYLTWENLYLFGNDVQQAELNRFRNKYVQQIVKRITCEHTCTCQSPTCKVSQVGTINAGPASDIDLNFIFTKDVQPDFCKLFKDIDLYHAKYFGQPLATLFDCNFYASDFRHEVMLYCIENLQPNIQKSQRLAAFERAQTVINKNKLPSPMVTCQNKKLGGNESFGITGKQATLNPRSKPPIPCPDYATALSKYYALLKTLDQDKSCDSTQLDTLFSLFTTTKRLEKETYYSVGAYLDIVKGSKHLPTSMYLDSILDNYGFAIQNLYHEFESCSDNDFIELKLMRFAKYLERICNTILIYFSREQIQVVPDCVHTYNDFIKIVLELLEASSKVNQERKRNKASRIQIQHLVQQMVNVLDNTTGNHCIGIGSVALCFDNITKICFHESLNMTECIN